MKWLLIPYKVLSWRVLFLLFTFFISKTAISEQCAPGQPQVKSLGIYCTGFGCNTPGNVFDLAGYNGEHACLLAADYLSESFTYSSATDTECNLKRVPGGEDFQSNINYFNFGCPVGYVEEGGQCVASCDPCQSGSAGENFWNGPKTGGGCIDGCAVEAVGGCISVTSEISGITSTSCTQTTFTGQLCTSEPNVVVGANVKDDIAVPPENDPPQSSQDCSPGTGFAQVNNETMCLPAGTTIDGETKTSTSNGGTTTETTTTTVNPDGTTTTETTSSFTDGDGNTISGSTTTQSGINQAGGGNNQDDKGLGPAPTFDQSVPDEPEINIITVPTPTLSMDIFTNTASCPAPITFTAMDQDFEISFDSVCAFADVIRGIILLISAIAAIRIVVKD